MRIITVQLPEIYIWQLENMIRKTGISRSELIRIAIREFLIYELKFVEEMKKENRRIRAMRIFNYCINCGNPLHNLSNSNHFFYRAIEIFKLKFCCSCFEQFKDKTLDEFPEELIDKIIKMIKKYKKILSISHEEGS